MPSTTGYSFGDIYLVLFPFTNQAGAKPRPAVIVSSATYNRVRHDVVVMAVTSQAAQTRLFGEVPVIEWQKAGSIKASSVKPVFLTMDKANLIRKIGALEQADQAALKEEIPNLIG